MEKTPSIHCPSPSKNPGVAGVFFPHGSSSQLNNFDAFHVAFPAGEHRFAFCSPGEVLDPVNVGCSLDDLNG